MSHPLLKRRENLVFYAAVWGIVIVLHALILNINQGVNWLWSLQDSLVFNLLFAALGLGIWYPCSYTPPGKTAAAKLVVSHVAAGVIVVLLWLSISHFMLTNLIIDAPAYESFLRQSLVWRAVAGLLFYLTIIAFYYVLIYSENLHKQAMRETELRALVKDAELRSLKFQINPHFIFNSLNSIYSLTMSNPKKAGEMTTKLGDYLRYTLATGDKQTSKLREELNSVRTYLEIEKVRFGDKIAYSEQIDPDCLESAIPCMLLQPLFENAIKHGVYESLQPVQIRLTCNSGDAFIVIALENTFEPGTPSRKGEQIGLTNTADRLHKMYNRRDLLNIVRADNMFRVSIKIPRTQDGR